MKTKTENISVTTQELVQTSSKFISVNQSPLLMVSNIDCTTNKLIWTEIEGTQAYILST